MMTERNPRGTRPEDGSGTKRTDRPDPEREGASSFYREAAVPALFFIACAAVYGQGLMVYLRPFVQFLFDPLAPGQALRASMYWIGMHLALPLVGALVGAFIADFIEQRRQSPPPSE